MLIKPTPCEEKTQPLSRRSFIKGAAGLATSAIAGGSLVQNAAAQFGYRGEIYYDAARDRYVGRWGIVEHHYPEMNPTGEKFTFVRLKYPGGNHRYRESDWWTNIVNFYRSWPSDQRFAEVLAANTAINVEVREHPQYVDIDDAGLFAYPYLFMTGHRGIQLSAAQIRKMREYLERGGFLHVEDCDARLDRGRGGLRPHIHYMMEQVYPEKSFETLQMDHPIYHTLYEHDEYLGGDKLIPGVCDADEAIMDGDRVMVYFCPSDLNCAWEGRPCSPGGDEQRTWAFKQGMNVVAYALTR